MGDVALGPVDDGGVAVSTNRPFVAAALVLGVFIAGLVSGGALVALGARERGGPPPHHHGPPGPHGPGERRPHGPPPPERIVGMLQERLTLDEAQVERVREIVARQEQAVEAAMASSRPAIERALGEGEAAIREVLRPEQREAFEQIVRERRERFPGRGPPPPPR